MILDGKDIGKLQGKGAKVLKNDKQVKSDTDYLREISQTLRLLLNKPEPKEIVQPTEPPTINVQPPEVVVNLPEKQEPKQWKFDLKKNDKGQTTEIIATAIG